MKNTTCKQLREELGNLKTDFGLFSDFLQEAKNIADLDKLKSWRNRIPADIKNLDIMFFEPEVALDIAANALSYKIRTSRMGDRSQPNQQAIKKQLRVDRKRRAIIVPVIYPNLTTLGYLGPNIITDTDFKMQDSNILRLPEKLLVTGNMDLENTNTKNLPRNLHVIGDLYIGDNVGKLPKKIRVTKNVTINVKGEDVKFPDYFVSIGGDVKIICHGRKTPHAEIKKQLEKLKAEGKIQGKVEVRRSII